MALNCSTSIPLYPSAGDPGRHGYLTFGILTTFGFIAGNTLVVIIFYNYLFIHSLSAWQIIRSGVDNKFLLLAYRHDGGKENCMAKYNPRIIVEVRGGVVQAVYSDTVGVSVAVLDYDEIATEDATPEFVKLEAETKGMLEII
jgi:hypothetical protein